MKKVLLFLALAATLIAGRLLYLAQTTDVPETPTEAPLLTIDQILQATDLQAGIKSAVKNRDDQAFKQWMAQAYEVGEAAGLSDADLVYLASEQCMDYMRFNAKRTLFNDEFEQRYKALLPIDDLIVKYPEAGDLVEKAQALLVKRDSLIEQMAQTLAGGGIVDNGHLDQAKALWIERYSAAPPTPQ